MKKVSQMLRQFSKNPYLVIFFVWVFSLGGVLVVLNASSSEQTKTQLFAAGSCSEEEHTYHARHLFAILLPLEQMTIKRNAFVDQLIKHNIGSGVHFAPVHLHPYYRKTFKYKKGDFPNAEYIGERILSLPLAPNLSESDVKEVIATVAELMKKYRKKKK